MGQNTCPKVDDCSKITTLCYCKYHTNIEYKISVFFLVYKFFV